QPPEGGGRSGVGLAADLADVEPERSRVVRPSEGPSASSENLSRGARNHDGPLPSAEAGQVRARWAPHVGTTPVRTSGTQAIKLGFGPEPSNRLAHSGSDLPTSA